MERSHHMSSRRARDPDTDRPARERPSTGVRPGALAFTRFAGNAAVARLLTAGAMQAKLEVGEGNTVRRKCAECEEEETTSANPASVQAKLEVGPTDDPFELEADRVAERVIGMSEPPTSRTGGGVSPGTVEVRRRIEKLEPDEVVRRKSERSAPTDSPKLESRIGALGAGVSLSPEVRAFFEPRFGYDFGAVNVHTGPAATQTARMVRARAFAIGSELVFAAGEYAPGTREGARLLAHELTHVVQQGATSPLTAQPATAATVDRQPLPRHHAASRAVVQRAPNCEGPAEVAAETTAEERPGTVISPAGADVPDDENLEAGVEWPRACELNFEWWNELRLTEVRPLRELDPETQPRAWANRTLRVQRLMFESGVTAVEGAVLRRDGILGPRTLLGLAEVAGDESHPARSQIQGLGFDLEAIRDAAHALSRARAQARSPEFLVQTPIHVLGENAIRYYDANFYMVSRDLQVLDELIFGSAAPEGIRRQDRIELLRRLYGQESQRLHGTATLVRVHRDFIHTEIDVSRAVERDRRRRIDRSHWFAFVASSNLMVGALERYFGVATRLDEATRGLPRARANEAREAVELLGTQEPGLPSAPPEIAAVLVAIYLPVLDPAVREPVVEAYRVEKAERERAEREAIEEHNRETARQRADRLVALIEAEDMYGPLRGARFRTELNNNLRESSFFELVLDDLAARPSNMFGRLYDEIEELGDQVALTALIELSLVGRYANHARVRRAVGTLVQRHGDLRRHGYVVTGAGAVLLDGRDRLEPGEAGSEVRPEEVAGEINSAFLRDEDREQLKPEAEQRLTAELENQGRLYMERLLAGQESPRTRDELGHHLLQLAWQEARLDPDNDIEDVEVQESLRLLGVRRAPDRGDGVPRYEVQYEVVKRVLGTSAGDTRWTPVEGTRGWRSEAEFENALFWYSYSQTADIVQTAAVVVAVGAVVIVAWEVGVIAALVSAGGGALPVGISVGASLAIYMLTHERWTLEGLLVAAIEGYLAAVGFRIFAPVGRAVSRLVIPATLEQVAFRRLVASWLLRHGAVGALTGGTVGPASLFVQDLVRVAQTGGDFRPFAAYLQAAGWGMLLGAAFEIGGSLLLAPLFRAADDTVLRRLSDVVRMLRSADPPITPSQWLSEARGALENTRAWLGNTLDEALANGIFATLRERLEQTGSQLLVGVRATLQREVLEITGTTLSREAVEGLERLVRVGRGAMSDDALATLLQQTRRTPERVEPWLRFLGGVDETLVTGLVERSQLRALFDAEALLALASRRSAAEVGALMSTRFANSIDDLNPFAARVNTLDEGLADRVLDLLRTRGTAVTPRALLKMAESGAGLEEELLTGLQRLLGEANPGRLDAVLEAMADDQIGAFLRTARGAAQADLETMGRLINTHEAVPAGWALRLPAGEAETLLNRLTPDARAAIVDMTPLQAQEAITALGIDRVNRALGGGATGILRGSHLHSLRERLHPRSVEDLLDWAGTAQNRLGRAASLAENLDLAAARLPAGTRLSPDTLILDTNATAAIDELLHRTGGAGAPIRFAELDLNRQEAINAIRAARGLGDFVDPPAGVRPTVEDIVGPGADLRATSVVGAEIIRGEGLTGRASGVLGELGAITPARAHADYGAVVGDLAEPHGVATQAVGGPKGAADRAVIADAMFAETTGGAVPRLVTTDPDIVVRLAHNFAQPTRFTPAPGGVSAFNQLAAHPDFSSGRFTIGIRGHRLEVIFRPPP